MAGRILFLMAATALQVVLAIAILPLTTVILSAADFGYFALMMSVAAFANAVGDGGGSLALHAHYGVVSPEERRRMLASFFAVSLCLSSMLAVLLLITWPLLAPYFLTGHADESSWLILGLVAVVVPLRSISVLATSTLSVGGRSNAIAIQIVIQAIGTFGTTLICLFMLHWGVASLFAGTVGGQIAALSVAAISLGKQPWARPSRRWLAVVRHHAPTSVFSGISDGIRGIGENGTIAACLSVATLGYYSHARLYYGMLLTATNSVAHNVWSISLAEARTTDSDFPITSSVWPFVHICLMLFGFGFVCFGTEFVGALTHDRLTPAAQWVPWLAVLLLINLSGRAQNALIYAHGAAAEAARVRAFLSLAALAALPLVMAKSYGLGLGLSGLMIVLLVEAILFRVYLWRKSAVFRKLETFHDGWALGGSCAIATVSLLSGHHEWSLWLRGPVFISAVAVVIVLERERIVSVLSSLQNPRKLR